MDKIRLIYYVNNKSALNQSVSITYMNQVDYFDISVIEKLEIVQGNSQGREVIEVSLVSREDLNGVTDMRVEIGHNTYDLWLPVNFIRFRHSECHSVTGETLEMTILPDRQFASFESLSQVIPAMLGGR